MIPFPDTFENRNQVDIFSIEIPWSNGPTVTKDSWNIHISDGNQRAWHIFITTTDSDKSINIMTTHGCLNGVSDDIPRGQRETHPLGPHGNPIRNSNGPELHRPSTGVLNTDFGQFTKVMQVDITRRVFSPS